MAKQFELNLFPEVREQQPPEEIKPEKIEEMPDGDVVIYRNLFNKKESDDFFSELLKTTEWQLEYIKLFGKTIPLPRLTAWYGDSNKLYTYSGIKMTSKPWTPTLRKIKDKIEPLAKVEFNSVLLNRYRDGKDTVSWHSDDEPELGETPVIGSVSFGETRDFQFRRKDDKSKKIEMKLDRGSFLLMRGTTQKFWQHQVPKRLKVVRERINLTFRVIT